MSFSPLTQRLLAWGLLLLLLLLLSSAIISLGQNIGGSLERLEDARYRAARMEALLERPPLRAAAPPSPTYYFEAPTYEAAAALASSAVGAAAAVAEMSVAPVATGADPAENPNLIRLSVAAEGEEQKLLRFIAALETGSPAIRVREWRIRRADADPALLRLEAVVLAAWGGAA
jgi:hypothetical protein